MDNFLSSQTDGLPQLQGVGTAWSWSVSASWPGIGWVLCGVSTLLFFFLVSVHFNSICQPHSYALVSLLVALACLHLLMSSEIIQVLVHLQATFLCACFIAQGSRISTFIDFRDQRSFSSIPFVSHILMFLLHCSWLSHLNFYWFPRREIVQFYSICKLHSYVLASLLMALASLPLLIFEIRDRSVLFQFVSHILMCLLHCSWLSSLYLYWFSRSEIVQLYSVCKPHSYVLASFTAVPVVSLQSSDFWKLANCFHSVPFQSHILSSFLTKHL